VIVIVSLENIFRKQGRGKPTTLRNQSWFQPRALRAE